ncbi:MAG: CAP domain-containing protein [Planctomycetes bacterium]|nr:CAP domain-containing protein [Planctomycetota bacterium]
MKLYSLIVAVLLLPLLPARSAELSDTQKREITSAVQSFRGTHVTDSQRLAQSRKFVELGSQAVQAWNRAMAEELGLITEKIKPFTNPPLPDKRVAELREKLRALQESDELSEEQLEEQGRSALQELLRGYEQQSAKQAVERNKRRQIQQQLQRMNDFLEKVRADASLTSLSTMSSVKQIKQLQTELLSSPLARIDYVREQNANLAKKIHRAEADGIRYLNEMRIVMGLKPTLIDPKLCMAARGHSKDMQTLDFFDHESPVEGKTTFLDRARLAGTKANSENIYWGSPNERTAIDVWFSSPPHHRNMFDSDWTHQGIGRWEDHWTQMFRQ